MTVADLLVVGTGPAGMAAAIRARQSGLSTIVVDDQRAPGGQIWRSIETAASREAILGAAYVEGRDVASAFRAAGVDYRPGTQLWQIEEGFRVFVSQNRRPEVIAAATVLLATGAMERPVPFPGWTLPGVMTVGAAQILLKTSGQVPDHPVWIAGSGPLPLLYAVQLLRAGGSIAGYLDTTPAGQWRSALRHISGAARGWSDIAKGLGWIASLRRSGVAVVRHVTGIEALGEDCLTTLRYRTSNGRVVEQAADVLLVHEGVVPNIHVASSLGCEMRWDAAQECFAPIVDEWGQSSRPGVFIAGDGAGIVGARASRWQGDLAALGVARSLGRVTAQHAEQEAGPTRRHIARETGARAFLDAMFRPRPEVVAPSDDTIVCRCEEVTAGEIREAATGAVVGPNQIKAALRVGMGPCQGRQCGYPVARLIGAAQRRSPAEVGYYHVRPPLKPITLEELAQLHEVIGVQEN